MPIEIDLRSRLNGVCGNAPVLEDQLVDGCWRVPSIRSGNSGGTAEALHGSAGSYLDAVVNAAGDQIRYEAARCDFAWILSNRMDATISCARKERSCLWKVLTDSAKDGHSLEQTVAGPAYSGLDGYRVRDPERRENAEHYASDSVEVDLRIAFGGGHTPSGGESCPYWQHGCSTTIATARAGASGVT